MGAARNAARALAPAIGLSIVSAIALAQVTARVEGTRPPCVEVRAEARMQAYGFDHVVTIRNGCETRQRCRISTSVAPTPVTLTLEPAEARETLTWRGSPASAFTATVDCAAP